MRKLFLILAIAAIGAVVSWRWNIDAYPADWPWPAMPFGTRGGCVDLAGQYDGVHDSIPRILSGKPVWEQGMRPWFEHKAVVTQADDSSWIEFAFELNERGLPAHRDHVFEHGRGWPSGSKLRLERRNHYDCGIRWIRMRQDEAANGRVRVGKDRKGNLILAYTKEELQGISFFDAVGPSWKADVTRWLRWTRRSPGADEALRAVQKMVVYRLKRHAVHGERQLITIGNYTGAAVCMRLWNTAAAQPDDASANVRSATGRIGTRERTASGRIEVKQPCGPGWIFFEPLRADNFFLDIGAGSNAAYRLAWRPLADPAAVPQTRDLGDPTALPLPPNHKP